MKNIKMNSSRWIAGAALTTMMAGSTLVTTTPAQADSSTWKKVAIGAGIVTGYGLIKGKGKVATIGAAATAGSYYMYRKDKKQEEEARRQAWYQQRYGSNWRNYYQPGS